VLQVDDSANDRSLVKVAISLTRTPFEFYEAKDANGMKMIQKMSSESGYLYVEATGRFSLEEAKSTFVEMLEAIARNKAGKVLFNGRELEGDPKVMERFYYGEFVAESVAKFEPRGVAFAYVLEGSMRDPKRFGETVARNRGMIVTTFEHLDDALGWLGVAPANNPEAGDGN